MGDKVLIATAEALKEAVNDYHGFLARWGGDEFVVALMDADDKMINSFKKDLAAELEKIKASRSLPFDINISMGQEICTDSNATLSEVINSADDRLYEAKEAKNINRVSVA